MCTTIVFQGRDQDMDACLASGLVESILHFDFYMIPLHRLLVPRLSMIYDSPCPSS